jgi:parallel beta-helix repeat protein
VHVRNGCTVANVTSRDNKDHGFISEAWTVMEPTYNKNASNFIQCSAQGNDGHGFFVTHSCAFTDCTADDNGSAPIGGLSTGDGFHAGDNCRLSNCVASNNQHSGIYGENGNTVDGCTATGNQQYGIEMLSDSNTVIRNTLRDNTLAPIQPTPGTNGIAPLQAPATATHPFANFGL